MDAKCEDQEDLTLHGEAGLSLRGKGGIIDLAGEKLKQLQGRVFHAVVDNNRILQYRISQDGRLILEKTIKSLHLDSLKDKSSRLLERATDKSKRKWRKVVTGDPDKRIRDHMKETPQVKFIDKLSFTLGVVVIVLSEWIALRTPSYFPPFYFLLMWLLLMWRYVSYKAEKFQYFMLDFCYYVNLSVFLQYYLAPGNCLWFKMNYIFAMGPLCCAIIVWRNSLVFHSLDKVTSFFLHALPPLSLHLTRWNFIPELSSALSSSSDGCFQFSFPDFFVFPLVFYLVWQSGYLLLTEIILAQQFIDDPELITALRYLAQDRKSSTNKALHAYLRSNGVLGEGEFLDPATLKCKMMFVAIQLAYTTVTIVHVPLLYASYSLSCVYLALIFTWGTWNGASYYIEVFSKRYNVQFDETIRRAESTPTAAADATPRPRLDTTDTECQTTTADSDDDDDDDDDGVGLHEFSDAEGQVLTEDMAEELYSALAGLEPASARYSFAATSTTTATATTTTTTKKHHED